MEINSGQPLKRTLDDYEFTFANGIPLSVSLDLDLGDTIKFSEPYIFIKLVEKASPLNASNKLASEEITIVMAQLLAWHHRRREQVGLSIDEQVDLQEFMTKMSETIN